VQHHPATNAKWTEYENLIGLRIAIGKRYSSTFRWDTYIGEDREVAYIIIVSRVIVQITFHWCVTFNTYEDRSRLLFWFSLMSSGFPWWSCSPSKTVILDSIMTGIGRVFLKKFWLTVNYNFGPTFLYPFPPTFPFPFHSIITLALHPFPYLPFPSVDLQAVVWSFVKRCVWNQE